MMTQEHCRDWTLPPKKKANKYWRRSYQIPRLGPITPCAATYSVKKPQSTARHATSAYTGEEPARPRDSPTPPNIMP
ncbi:hypothetical protein BaRGS_00024951 [Batillaria attramentaria]|uniref:Uncharacterized protein n=1 Tax=Batillaria attramentaria TaxID=370345 RepID=A0ABD0K9T7_9CAEN